ncbi:hypothetical protein QYF50_07115 [Paenibacillus vini]|uniref:hypothetical protein n=1 Tax=Paenibacillus vini TaxID=1476024 RepID=UPI0025B68F33|nr:hypothetical protein [Paenibacillus vini]MDN4067662.1 hypothetical protein [Paenibacillus vini]
MQLTLFDIEPNFMYHRKYREGIFKTKAEIEDLLKEQGRDRIYYVLSFGGGTQSAHLLEQHFRGEIHYDYIIFSDTGAEPDFIHGQVEWWKQRQKEFNNTTPFIITRHGSMDRGLGIIKGSKCPSTVIRWIHIPEKIKAAGMMPRQCTVDFKIIPVKQKARSLVMEELGLGFRQQMPSNIGFIIDIGFSYDEIKRINTFQSPQFKYMYLAYPLVEENMISEQSIEFLELHGFPSKRSRCYLCPFNCGSDRNNGMDWEEIIECEPLSFLKACYFDEELRKVQSTGKKIMHSIPYLHFSRQPLKEVYKFDYKVISVMFRNAFVAWLDEWDKILMEIYQINLTRASALKYEPETSNRNYPEAINL